MNVNICRDKYLQEFLFRLKCWNHVLDSRKKYIFHHLWIVISTSIIDLLFLAMKDTDRWFFHVENIFLISERFIVTLQSIDCASNSKQSKLLWFSNIVKIFLIFGVSLHFNYFQVHSDSKWYCMLGPHLWVKRIFRKSISIWEKNLKPYNFEQWNNYY